MGDSPFFMAMVFTSCEQLTTNHWYLIIACRIFGDVQAAQGSLQGRFGAGRVDVGSVCSQAVFGAFFRRFGTVYVDVLRFSEAGVMTVTVLSWTSRKPDATVTYWRFPPLS